LVDGKATVGEIIEGAGLSQENGMKMIRGMLERREIRIKR
jgi:hypothetical protein